MPYCQHCGAEHSDEATFCPQCGSWVATVGNLPRPATPSRYAGFWPRVGSYLIDYLLIAIPINVVAQIFFIQQQPTVTTTTDPASGQDTLHWQGDWAGFLLVLALSILANWLYTSLMLSSTRQATVGKLALGLIATDEAGERIGFGRASGRYFASWTCVLTCGIGYLMVIWTARKQGLHDKIAGTLVVPRKPTTPGSLS